MNKPKIAIGYVRGDGVEGAFHDSVLRFLDFDSRNHRVCLAPGFVKGLYVDDNRNELTRDFLKLSADYLLSIDTDIEFAPEQVYQLVDEAVNNNRAILSGLYFSYLYHEENRGKLLPVWFKGFCEGGSLNVYVESGPTDMVVELDACGAGFCLIRRDVFETMTKRLDWAADGWTWYGRDPYTWKGIPARMGEDTCFCVRAKKVGFQTWGHKGIQVAHWKKIPLTAELFRAVVEYAKKTGAAW